MSCLGIDSDIDSSIDLDIEGRIPNIDATNYILISFMNNIIKDNSTLKGFDIGATNNVDFVSALVSNCIVMGMPVREDIEVVSFNISYDLIIVANSHLIKPMKIHQMINLLLHQYQSI